MELLLTLMVHYSLVLDASENFVVIYVNLYLCSVVSYSLETNCRHWIFCFEQGGNDHEIYESEQTVGHTGKLDFDL